MSLNRNIKRFNHADTTPKRINWRTKCCNVLVREFKPFSTTDDTQLLLNIWEIEWDEEFQIFYDGGHFQCLTLQYCPLCGNKQPNSYVNTRP
jgi:hypothetical protein